MDGASAENLQTSPPAGPGAVPGAAGISRFRTPLFLAVFPLLAFLLLWEVLVGGKVLLPAEYLKGFQPWSAAFPPEVRAAVPQWNVLQWDGMAEFFPWRLFAARSFAEGRIPLWDPHVLSGTPFLANSQSAPLYPLHLLLYLPPEAGEAQTVAVRMGWLAFLHLSLAGSFAYLLARELGARPLAAVVGGAAFQLSGFAVAWLELPSFISVSCWLPLAMLCLSRALRSRSWRWGAGGGLSVGMMLLAGHLQIAFYGLLALGFLWVWETVALFRQREPEKGTDRPWHRLGPPVGLGLLVVALGLGLAAAQFLPSLELSRMSHRAAAPSQTGFQEYVKLAMPLQNWITLLVPDYYGLPVRNDFWGYWNYGPPNVMEYAGHVGAGAFLLGLIGLWQGRRIDGRVGFLGLLGVLALLLAAGSPLTRLFYFGIPGFSQSGSPARALVLFCLAQALLAALGLEVLLRRAEARWQSVLVPAGVAAALTTGLILGFHFAAQQQLVSLGLLPGEIARQTEQVAQPAMVRALAYAALTGFLMGLLAWLFRENKAHHRTAVLGTAVVLLVAGGLLLVGGSYNLLSTPEMAYPPTPLTDQLRTARGRVAVLNQEWDIVRQPRALLPPNSAIAYGYRGIQGYDSLLLGSYRSLADAVNRPEPSASPAANGNILFLKHAGSPLLPYFGAEWVVSGKRLALPVLELVAQATAEGPFLYRDPRALPEAYLASEWKELPDPEAATYLSRPGAAARRAATLAAGASPRPVTAVSEAASPGSSAALPEVRLDRRAPGSISAAVHAPLPALLVLAEGYAPGWKATLHGEDGRQSPVRVRRANIGFQAVQLPAGASRVEWRYLPESFRVGLYVTLICLALAVGVILGRPRPRRAL